jgi:opacity protein-like surface antigen
MKKLLTVILFVSAPAFGTTNQLDFMWGRCSPLGSVQAQGSTEQDGLRGSCWNADALHHVSDRFYIGMGFGQFRSADNNSTTFMANSIATISSRKTSTLLLGRMDLTTTSHFVTYAIAGLGWVQNSLTVNSDQGTIVDQSRSTFGFSGGLGFDVLVTQALVIGIETRYDGSPAQHFGMTAAGAAATGQTDLRTSADLFSVGLKAGIKY